MVKSLSSTALSIANLGVFDSPAGIDNNAPGVVSPPTPILPAEVIRSFSPTPP